MSITRFDQDIKSGDGSNYDHSVTFKSIAVPAGALIVVKWSTAENPSMNQPAGLAGDTFVHGPSSTAGSNNIDTWYVLGSVGGTIAVSASFTNGASQYGASIEVYTGGTFTYDSANSGTVVGSYTTSPTVTPSLSTSGAGLIATVFGQYNVPWTGATASQTPGDVVNQSAAVDGTCVMASGELINSSAFSGTVSVEIQKATPAYTKCDVVYASFLVSGGSSNSLAGSSIFGAIGSGASVSAQNAAAASSSAGALAATGAVTAHAVAAGIGTFGKLAAVGSVALAASMGGNSAFQGFQSSATASAHAEAVGNSQFGALASRATVGAKTTLVGKSVLGPLASAGSIAATASAAGASTFGALICSGTIPYTHQNTLAGASTFGALSSSASANASQGVAGAASFGALGTDGTASQHASAVAVSTFGPITSTGTIPFQNFNTLAGNSLFGRLGSSGSLSGGQSIAGASTFAPLACSGTINTTAPSLPADGWYYVQLPPRYWYTALPARAFYVKATPMPAQYFSNKDSRESVVLTLDASADLDTGETLTGITATDVTVIAGPADPSPSSLVGTPAINSAAVTITLPNGSTVTVGANKGVQVEAMGGLANCVYLIAFTCATSNPDKILVLKGVLPVNNN